MSRHTESDRRAYPSLLAPLPPEPRRPHMPDPGVGWIVDALRTAPAWMWDELLSERAAAPYYRFLEAA